MKFNINILYWIAMAGLLVYFAYIRGWIYADFPFITADQAYTILHEDDNVTLLDVRTENEYKYGHIKGTILIPLKELNSQLSKLPKDKKIIVYCQSGNRSITASRLLKKNGFTPINLTGGYLAWRRAGLDKR